MQSVYLFRFKTYAMKDLQIIFRYILLSTIILGTTYLGLIPIQASPEKIVNINEDDNRYFGQSAQTQLTFNTTPSQQNVDENKTIHVEVSTNPPIPNPRNQTQIQITFMNKETNSTQRHVDYKVSIMKANNQIFSILLSHSVDGLASFPYTFQEAGMYQIIIEVDDVLFLPIPPETTMFPIVVGGLQNTNQTVLVSSKVYNVTITIGSGLSQSCVSTHNCFDPQIINIIPGSTVTWTNNDSVAHTVTSGNTSDSQTGNIFSSSMIPAGKTFSFTFYDKNDYNYFCQVHPWMTGQIIVSNTGISNTSVPEFPLVLPIMLTSFFSLILLYKIKFL